MPADPRARPVLIDEHLLEGVCRAAKDFGDFLAESFEEGRERLRLEHLPATVVVAKSKGDDLSVGLVSVKVKGFEGKSGELGRKPLLLLGAQQIGLIPEAFRQKEARLSIS